MPGRVAMYNANRLKLGLFGVNCSSGRAVTMVPERWSGSWADCLRLARAADAAGIDFMLPIGRWKGYGGQTDYQGETLETITWATGLLAQTRHLTVFGTVHAPLFHPVIAAKQIVTADHVGEGRFGLNVVCGWNEDEFEMFGVAQREHDARYAYAQEWLDALKMMWGDAETFDFPGQFITLAKVRAMPKPYGGTRPLIMNAGISPTGQAFAIRNCDALFVSTTQDTFEDTAALVARVQAQARQLGRDIGLYTVGVVTCRPTTREAEDYYHHCMVEHADWDAVDSILAKRGATPESLGAEAFERARRRTAHGLSGLPLIGDPDRVAAGLAHLSAAGLSGIALSMVNYADELPYFCEAVLPRLERLGLRVPRQSDASAP
ncbi:MAG: LLM class flavin-dependent oxidoreductase [Alphaproteobacteria bacterium]|nr:LLM class flavin-dependent oxidoreductase [Alphaproteobacteria bacterium]